MRRPWPTPRPLRADRAAAPHTGRSGTAPSCRRGRGAATRTARNRPARPKPGSEMDPLVQDLRLAGVDRELLDEVRDARVVPCGAKARPDLVQRVAPEIAADEGQGVDELDEAVRQHD